MGKGKDYILDALMESPLSIEGLKTRTGLSDSYVRNTVRFMESKGQLEKVDQRIPYMYRVPPSNPALKLREAIKAYEEELLNPQSNADLINLLKKVPKNGWVEAADEMEACAIAIRNLHERGLLIETIETLDDTA